MNFLEAETCQRLLDAFFGFSHEADRVRISEKRFNYRVSIESAPGDSIQGDADTVEELGRILTGEELQQCDACTILHLPEELRHTDTSAGEGAFCVKCLGVES